MAPPPPVTPERGAGYGSMTESSPGPAYPETDHALRDRIRVGRRAPAAIIGCALAWAATAAARLHRWAGEPRNRVLRRPPAGAVLRPVPVHLGNADWPDPDLPDDRLLHGRPAGRSPPGCAAALQAHGGGRAADGGHSDPVAANPVAGAERLRTAVDRSRARVASLGDHPVRGTGHPAGDGLALCDPAPDPPPGDGRRRRRCRRCPFDAGLQPAHLRAGLLGGCQLRSSAGDRP